MDGCLRRVNLDGIGAYIDGAVSTFPMMISGVSGQSATLSTIFPRLWQPLRASISCAVRASESGRTVPTHGTSVLASNISASRARCAAVTSTMKKIERVSCCCARWGSDTDEMMMPPGLPAGLDILAWLLRPTPRS
jgi:hypothetical protein